MKTNRKDIGHFFLIFKSILKIHLHTILITFDVLYKFLYIKENLSFYIYIFLYLQGHS